MNRYLMPNTLLRPIVAASLLFIAGTAAVNAQERFINLDLGNEDCRVRLQQDSPVSVNSVTFNFEAQVDADNQPGDSCLSVAGGGDGVVVSLNVQPTEVEAGDTVSVTWSVLGYVSPQVTTCNASGPNGFASEFLASPASGSGSYTLNSATTFSATCRNEDGSAIPVLVNGQQPAGNDGFPPPPLDICGPEPAGRSLPFAYKYVLEPNDRSGRNYADVWNVWAEDNTNEAEVQIPAGEYVALPFYVNTTPGRYWQVSWLGNPTVAAETQVSISRCPGDFTGAGYDDERCNRTSGSQGGSMLALTDVNEQGDGLACPMVPGATEVYYLNIRSTNAQGANRCNRSRCTFFANPRFTN